MASSNPTASLSPLRFALGPWPSPADPGWQAGYDALVAAHPPAAGRLYGLLDAELAPIPLEEQLSGGRRRQRVEAEGWVEAWVASALPVIARYHRRVAAFEVLSRPNLPGPIEDAPRIHPTWFAAALTALDQALRGQGYDGVTIVAGALVGGQVGRLRAAEYASAALRAGRHHFGWPARGLGPVTAWAMHPELDSPRGDAEGGGYREADRFATSMRRRGGARMRVYVSGFVTWSGTESALAGPLARRLAADKRFVLAAREALPEGPMAPTFGTTAYTRDEGQSPADAALAEAGGGAWVIHELTPPSPASAVDLGSGASLEGTTSFDVAGGLAPASGVLPAGEPAPPGGVPTADGFDPPVGARDQPAWTGYRNAAGLVDEDYFRARRAWHTGEDWNGVGGGDSDLGDPVFAIGHGLVRAARKGKDTWGNIVLIEHRLPDGTPLWSQYAHLKDMMVSEGQVVSRGQQIGTLGKGNPPPSAPWPAHLHFEIRRTDLPFDNWKPMVLDRDKVLANYTAGRAFIDANRPGSLATGPTVVVDDRDPGFQKAPVPHWKSSPIGHNGGAVFTHPSRQPTNVASWTAELPEPGRYLVSTFVPRANATTRNATYTIVHQGGESLVRVNQRALSDVWQPLGTFDFGGQGVARLSDVTGEPPSTQIAVSFDALRWQRVA